MKPLLFGRYILLDRVAAGGMAEVFRAKTFGVEGFERILAIKRILPNLAEDREFINMFVDEARIAVRLSHPNIVPIYELGKIGEQYYIAMEYIPGKDMRSVLDHLRKAERKLPIPAAAFIVGQVCDGLDYAHHKYDTNGRPLNVIHRDVSPQNVLLSYDGVVKVTDFGIATAESRVSEKTQAGVLKGKFGYMSPEQVGGEKIDHRSDIFAVGILLYEMVAGARLFVGKSDLATLERVRNAEIPPPREVDPSIPEELERIMLKALARNRDERYQRASDLHDDLQRYLIVDNMIYNGKRLAEFIRAEYPEDLEQESARMEEFMRVQLPATEAQRTSALPSPTSMPTASGIAMVAFTPATVGSPAERTVIFESGHTEINTPAPLMKRAAAEREPERRPTHRPMIRGSKTVTSRGSKKKPRGIDWSNKRAAALTGSAAALVVMLIIFFSVLFSSSDTGSIVITSTPTRDVQIFLDGVLIAIGTPYTQRDLPVGEHILTARAAGYETKAYRFVLVPGEPAILNFALTEESAAGSRAPKTTVAAATGPLGSPEAGVAPQTSAAADHLSGSGGGRDDGTAGAAAPPATSSDGVAAAGAADAAVGTNTIIAGPAPEKGAATRSDLLPSSAVAEADTGTATNLAAAVDPATDTAERDARTNADAALTAVTGTTELQIDSVPTNATVYYQAKNRGRTPLKLVVGATEKVVLGLISLGYEMTYKTIELAGESRMSVKVYLKRRVITPSGPAGGSSDTRGDDSGRSSGSERPAVPEGCSGSAGLVSLMAIGALNCAVTIGEIRVGVAPFFKKKSPAGRCHIKVACDEGKRYSEMRTLAPGVPQKIIIRPEMWR